MKRSRYSERQIIEILREAETGEYYHYHRLMMLQGFNFENFLNALEKGNILINFDARTGHNLGTKFRLRQSARPELYSNIHVIL